MKKRTANNVHLAFVGEAKANQRLLLFAKKAENEDLPQIAHLFRAVAAAEGIHAQRHFTLLESVKDTQSNLEQILASSDWIPNKWYKFKLESMEGLPMHLGFRIRHDVDATGQAPNIRGIKNADILDITVIYSGYFVKPAEFTADRKGILEFETISQT